MPYQAAMDTAGVLQDFGLYTGAFLVCLISGIVPIINAEIFLIGAVALTSPTHPEIAVIVLMGTIGQMLAKAVTYWAARGALDLSLQKYEQRIEQWRDKFARSEPGLSAFILVSSFTGLPPFFITSILAGVFKIPFMRFLVVGSVGRYARFGLVAWAPALMMEWF